MKRPFFLPATTATVAFIFAVNGAFAHDLQPGLYEVKVRVALPNVKRPAATSVLKRCIERSEIEGHDAFRILSDTPLNKCPRFPICMGQGKAGFQVLCSGLAGARAQALFEAGSGKFSGTIRINMGDKNMTVIEYQEGRRIGTCF